MLLSAVSVLVVAQSIFEIPEGLMNNPVYQWMDCVGYLYRVGLERGSGRANRKWCACTERVEVKQVVEGEGVYMCVCG